MSQAVIYFDGGSSTPRGKSNHKGKRVTLSWGVVALFNDEMHEINGQVQKQWGSSLHGYHEYLAAFEAIMFAHNRGLEPTMCSFYTDDLYLATAVHHWHEENHAKTALKTLTDILDFVCEHFFNGNEDTLAVVIDYLQRSRIVWVKGHSGVVYNSRADYLVRQARHGAKLIPYDKWIEDFCVLGGDRATAIGYSFMTADRCHRCHFRNMM